MFCSSRSSRSTSTVGELYQGVVLSMGMFSIQLKREHVDDDATNIVVPPPTTATGTAGSVPGARPSTTVMQRDQAAVAAAGSAKQLAHQPPAYSTASGAKHGTVWIVNLSNSILVDYPVTIEYPLSYLREAEEDAVDAAVPRDRRSGSTALSGTGLRKRHTSQRRKSADDSTLKARKKTDEAAVEEEEAEEDNGDGDEDEEEDEGEEGEGGDTSSGESALPADVIKRALQHSRLTTAGSQPHRAV
jgi:hypothetical protein